MSHSSVASDVFSAVAGAQRRAVLDSLVGGERSVGSIVTDLSIPQPQVSKHLRVLSEAGLVRCRAAGRRRLYRLNPAQLQPLRDWIAQYEKVLGARLDQMDSYLQELHGKESPSGD